MRIQVTKMMRIRIRIHNSASYAMIVSIPDIKKIVGSIHRLKILFCKSVLFSNITISLVSY